MPHRPSLSTSPTVLEVSPADAAPGDELLWISDDPDGAAHRAIDVRRVVRDPAQQRVRVMSRDGAEYEFDAGRVVVVLRDGDELLQRSRASDAQPHQLDVVRQAAQPARAPP